VEETRSIDGLITLGVPMIITFFAASVAAVTDVMEYRVRNVLTFPLVVSGLAYHATFLGWAGFTDSLQGMLFGLGVLIMPWLLGLMGAGDVKLLAGVGAWLGMDGAVVAFVIASAAAGVYSIISIVYRGKFHESFLTIRLIFYRFVALGTYLGKDDLVGELSTGDDRRVRVIPFGAMVPIGVVGVLIWLRWFR
jgi:Flp pilus assembly protein protease CpaA